MKSFIDKLAWIYLRDKTILSTLSKGKDTWYFPGGKRDPGESDSEALIREIREELTVELVPDSLQLYGIFEAQAHGKPEGTVVRMTCYFAEYEGELQPDSEIAKMDFLTFAGKAISSPVDGLIFDDLLAKGLIKEA